MARMSMNRAAAVLALSPSTVVALDSAQASGLPVYERRTEKVNARRRAQSADWWVDWNIASCVRHVSKIESDLF